MFWGRGVQVFDFQGNDKWHPIQNGGGAIAVLVDYQLLTHHAPSVPSPLDLSLLPPVSAEGRFRPRRPVFGAPVSAEGRFRTRRPALLVAPI